ncbi:DUF4134 family protein [uncultured Fibrella sp.]|uniref:DUF4134 family protein n=1 Tax=uncultured Fibrella sp. TaxID=1284596 RepID=UPI0035CB33F3
MKKTYWYITAYLILIVASPAIAQTVDVNLTSAGDRYGDSYLQKQITTPLARNLSIFVRFVYSVCAVTALLGALRIYVRVQTGEAEATRDIWRWGAAILTVLGLTTGLGHLLENQSFGRGVIVSSQSLQIENAPIAAPALDGLDPVGPPPIDPALPGNMPSPD